MLRKLEGAAPLIQSDISTSVIPLLLGRLIKCRAFEKSNIWACKSRVPKLEWVEGGRGRSGLCPWHREAWGCHIEDMVGRSVPGGRRPWLMRLLLSVARAEVWLVAQPQLYL